VQRTVLAELDEIAIARARWEPHDAAPPRRHEGHAECVYVLEGRLDVVLDESRELEIGPDTLVYVPAGVAHTFVATSDEAHVLELRIPGASGDAVVREVATAETVEVSGNRIAFLLDAEETGGAVGAIEFLAPRAFAGPPPHIHRRMHDVAVVLEGALAFQLGDETGTAGPGELLLAPRGVAHTFSNPSEGPLRVLNLYVPGGFEQFFRERAAGTAAPAELTARYDWERA
jgi:mannose-6-phosphate isomerase-like protein (cupin superfamily)